MRDRRGGTDAAAEGADGKRAVGPADWNSRLNASDSNWASSSPSPRSSVCASAQGTRRIGGTRLEQTSVSRPLSSPAYSLRALHYIHLHLYPPSASACHFPAFEPIRPFRRFRPFHASFPPPSSRPSCPPSITIPPLSPSSTALLLFLSL
ncbi:hypothetical protein FKP32DRAFT_1591463 [Trametes sanguinea]|nr:hypothetical protein FKP32DRAFT_1591463 [Trametes sanguinea]